MKTDAFLAACLAEAQRYKKIGDACLQRLNHEQLHWQPHPQCNSMAMLVHHLSGNMRSRFTDFLSSDGEKPWRQRDAEFEPVAWQKAEIGEAWEAGWRIYLEVLQTLTSDELHLTVTIRNEPHTVMAAIQRQQAHYPYHIGQMTLLAKIQLGDAFASLSIPKNQSDAFLEEMQNKFKKP
ncbi:MAG: hypothetical protein C0424_03810 [Sphingobacteriaceae bacterium]|nr:hypothetical protein [Sphingobacteriaceae bacterium]